MLRLPHDGSWICYNYLTERQDHWYRCGVIACAASGPRCLSPYPSPFKLFGRSPARHGYGSLSLLPCMETSEHMHSSYVATFSALSNVRLLRYVDHHDCNTIPARDHHHGQQEPRHHPRWRHPRHRLSDSSDRQDLHSHRPPRFPKGCSHRRRDRKDSHARADQHPLPHSPIAAARPRRRPMAAPMDVRRHLAARSLLRRRRRLPRRAPDHRRAAQGRNNLLPRSDAHAPRRLRQRRARSGRVGYQSMLGRAAAPSLPDPEN